MRLSFHFVWEDMWVGVYWSKSSRALYVCPLPMCVLKLTFPRRGDIVSQPKGVTK